MYLRYMAMIVMGTCLSAAQAPAATPLGTGFTYQGQLKQNGQPFTGSINMAFTLWDAPGSGNPPSGGNLVGPVADPAPVTVTNGLFTQQLDFGDVFNGDRRWLQINVGGTTLAPRQELTAAPYALFAAGPWLNGPGGLTYSASNVGIGTSTPSTALEVNGTIRVSGLVLPTGAAAGKVLTSDASGNGTWQNAAGLTLPYSGSASSSTSAFSVTNTSTTALTNGARFESLSSSGRGVFATAPGIGVFGQCTSGAGYGIYGSATSTTTFGTTYGVYGQAVSANSYGVYGNSTATTGSPAGVYGTSASGTGYGVYGFNSFTGNDPNNAHAGGYFVCNAPYSQGVYGSSTGNGSAGVFGEGGTYGVDGYGPTGVVGATSGSGAGFYGVYSAGAFAATGTKSFQIDHPLDPENKYLSHYCTEGIEPYNVYKGHVTTDAKGYAWVDLPAYFEEINRDVDYQLTVIDNSDDFVLAKVTREVANHRFQIRTSKSAVKVCWEVKGVRNDRFVKTYGAPAEQDKPKEHRGKYLQPELYGRARERGQFYRPEHEGKPKVPEQNANPG